MRGHQVDDRRRVAPGRAVGEEDTRPEGMMPVEVAEECEVVARGEGAERRDESGGVADGGVVRVRGIVNRENMYTMSV